MKERIKHRYDREEDILNKRQEAHPETIHKSVMTCQKLATLKNRLEGVANVPN